jgi:ribosomal-protein-alanine N-acetyltransferase
MKTDLRIEPLDKTQEAAQCAELMVTSEPWITLRLARESVLAGLTDSAKEVYAIRDSRGIAAFIVVDMRGLLTGYIQVLCVRSDCRGRGLGSTLLQWAEDRIFRDSPNVFICVSSFNSGARRLYERRGFELVGVLRELFVPGHDEILLRKTRGTWAEFRERLQPGSGAGATDS